MQKFCFYAIAFSTMVTLNSCEKDLSSETETDEETEVPGQVSKTSARLSIKVVTTDVDNPIQSGRIYVFNDQNECIAVLNTSGDVHAATTELPAGTYSLYTIGGADLSHYELPTKENVTISSVITHLDNVSMNDLLQKIAVVTLEDGESLEQTITLDHKVFCLEQLEVNNVPDDVTKVEMTLSPLYKSIKLDGDYVTSETESYKIALTKSGETSTWQSDPDQMLFPSKGTPTIKVSFTSPAGVQSYSYTCSENLEANHHYKIIGNYSAPQGVELTGILTASEWGEDRIITFGFDEGNATLPLVGEKYKGYYVLSVNETAHTAIVRSKNNVAYTAPAANATETQWKAALNAALVGLEKPDGATEEWRIPTFEEASVFVNNPSLYPGKDASYVYYCLNNGTLEWIQAQHLLTTPEVCHGDSYAANYYLRPVITIAY